jgi:hypothetical protein
MRTFDIFLPFVVATANTVLLGILLGQLIPVQPDAVPFIPLSAAVVALAVGVSLGIGWRRIRWMIRHKTRIVEANS